MTHEIRTTLKVAIGLSGSLKDHAAGFEKMMTALETMRVALAPCHIEVAPPQLVRLRGPKKTPQTSATPLLDFIDEAAQPTSPTEPGHEVVAPPPASEKEKVESALPRPRLFGEVMGPRKSLAEAEDDDTSIPAFLRRSGEAKQAAPST